MKVNYGCRQSTEKKALMNAIREITGLAVRYAGPPTFSYQIGEYSLDRDGNLSLPDNEEAIALIKELQERGYRGAAEGGITPVAPQEDVIDEVPDRQQETPEERTAGLTISIPKEIIGDEDIPKLQKMLEAKGALIKKALGVAELPVVIEAEKVCFPWFEELPEADKTQTYMKFIAALCKLVKEQKKITAKEKPVENEKYAFRCFLLRLGFIGDEFKQDRKILMKNLDGSASFKHGRPEPVATERTLEVTA